MRWCVLLSALWHVLALLASELLPGPSVKRLALRSSMFSPRSLADGIGDRLHLRSAIVLPPHISHQISGHNQRK